MTTEVHFPDMDVRLDTKSRAPSHPGLDLSRRINQACDDIAAGRRLMTALDDIRKATEQFRRMSIWCPEDNARKILNGKE